jgi:hypothetical protein
MEYQVTNEVRNYFVAHSDGHVFTAPVKMVQFNGEYDYLNAYQIGLRLEEEF